MEEELQIDIETVLHDNIACTTCAKKVGALKSYRAKIQSLQEEMLKTKVELGQGLKVSLARARAKYAVVVEKRLSKFPSPQKENQPPSTNPRKHIKSSHGVERKPVMKSAGTQTIEDRTANIQVIDAWHYNGALLHAW